MIPVVFSSDHNFVMPTGIAIQSMLESAPNVIFDIYILQSDDVNESDRTSLRSLVGGFKSKITFISLGKEFANSYEIRSISTACYFRLLIPWLIPHYDKIIYLDGDIIIKSNISQIFEYVNNDNNYVYGVRTPGFTLDSDLVKHIESIGLTPTGYINSGILVLNLKLLRENNLKESFLSYKDMKFMYQDQDIINIVCKDRIGWLPIKFNTSTSLECVEKKRLINAGVTTESDFEDAVKNPIIIHYTGKKPWKTFTYHWYDWWAVYSRSPFYDPMLAYDLSTRILKPKYSIKQLTRMLIKTLFNR